MIIFISILGGLLLIAGLCLISLFLINKMFFAPPPFDNNSHGRKIEDYPCRKVAFKSGKNTLDGFILNENGEKGVVIVAHGMGKTVDYYIPEILLFAENGYEVFTFEYTGYRGTKGKFLGIPQATSDLKSAIDFVGEKKPVILFGHSLGGYSVCAVPAMTDKRIDKIVAYAPFNSIRTTLRNFAEIMNKKRSLGDGIFFVQKLIFGKNTDIKASDGLNSINIPALIIQGNHDEEVTEKCSLYSEKNAVTNPYVDFRLVTKDDSNAHMTVVRKAAESEVNTDTVKLVKEFLGIN